MVRLPQGLTPEIVQSLLKDIDYILLDIDGVLWSGDHVFDGVPETLQWLRSCNKKIRFLSNNSTMSRMTTAKKFAKKGLHGVTEGEVYTSAYAAALYLKHISGTPQPLNSNVFVIGEQGLHEELRNVLAPGKVTYGLELNGGSYEPNKVLKSIKASSLPAPGWRNKSVSAATAQTPSASGGISLDELDCRVVVAGLDFHFNMLKLSCASLCLQRKLTSQPDGAAHAAYVAAHNHPTVRYIATNEDPQLPIGSEGFLFPGAGCIIQSLNTVSGRKPDVVCGKPFQHMAKLLFEAENITDPSRCLMVGDRLTTDIAFGNLAGCKTLMVLTGCESRKDVDKAMAAKREELVPWYIGESLSSLRSLALGFEKLPAVSKL